MPPFKVILSLVLGVTLYSCSPEEHQRNGGYPFLTQVQPLDTTFYFLPLRDSLTTLDSFRYARMHYLFRAFDEPNLSLAPPQKDLYRFTFTGLDVAPVIITLTEGNITVKQGNQSDLYTYSEERLSEKEKQHLDFLTWNYPFDEAKATTNKSEKHYLDSIVALYPELKSADYYSALLNKTMIPLPTPFSYYTSTVPLTQKRYRNLVSLIDASGYWGLPYNVECSYKCADCGDGFILEAVTPTRYNCVVASACPVKSKFLQACKELVKAAKMDRKIKMMWESSAPESPQEQ